MLDRVYSNGKIEVCVAEFWNLSLKYLRFEEVPLYWKTTLIYYIRPYAIGHTNPH